MSRGQEKPKIIRKIEKSYDIKLSLYKPGKHYSKYFVLDKKQNITELNLDDCGIRNMNLINEITTLQRLSIKSNHLSRIEGFENLNNLEYLSLWFSKSIEKVEGLEKLTSLKELWIGNNCIAKIEGLDKLQSLEKLHIRGLKISKIEGLNSLINLKELEIISDDLKVIEGLEGLNQLETLSILDFNGPGLSEISNLNHLTRLKDLSLSGSFSEIENLDSLTQLTSLYLQGDIREIKNLENLKALRRLTLTNTQITHIKGLENQTELEYLNLMGGKLESVSNINHLVKLKELNLYSNQIREVKDISKLVHLEKLNLRLNKLTELPCLDALKSLQYLDVSQNCLSENPDVSHLNLTFFDCNYNPIKTPVEELTDEVVSSSSFLISHIGNINGYIKGGVSISTLFQQAGYVYQRTDNFVYSFKVTEKLRFRIKFKTEEILYFLNEYDIAVISGHMELGFLTYTELIHIAGKGNAMQDAWFFLLLPITSIEEDQLKEFRIELKKRLSNIQFKQSFSEKMIEYITNGLTAPNGTFIRNEFGVLDSKVNHSTRQCTLWKNQEEYISMIKALENI